MTEMRTSRRKLLKHGALLAGAASIGIPGTAAAAGCGTVCARSQGYWKNHPEAWPVQTLKIGGVEKSRDFWIENVLEQPVSGDKALILAKQLIAAKLNQYAGAEDSCIRYAGSADRCIGGGRCYAGVPYVADRWLATSGFMKIGTDQYEPQRQWELKVELFNKCTEKRDTVRVNGECLYDILDAYNNGKLCACKAD
ncbi:hypothetical protein ACFQH3_06655 [Haladaptatus sp. GCM10025707]|uniref:hypothetical protein n=1 Tax=unclassified Haladaptatus TaxID=2622732 RepID=UPI0023E8D014|nr:MULTISPECIES: hypothetical protein [unclassified Haladaptatus]